MARFHLQSRYQRFKTSLEPLLTYSEGSEHFEHLEDLEPGLLAALEVLTDWKKKKACLLQELKIDKGSVDASTELEDDIFKVDMATIDGALQILIHAAVQDFGPIARDVFQAIFSPLSASSAREKAFATVTYENFEKLCGAFAAGTFFFIDQPISHHVIVMEPAASVANPRFTYKHPEDTWTINYRTVGIAHQMSEKLKQLDNAQLGKFFKLFRSYLQSAPLAGWMLEPIAQRILCANTRHNLPLVKMHGDLSDDAPVLNVDFEADIPDGLQLPTGKRHEVKFHPTGLTKLTDKAYYTPTITTHPFFDSFLVQQVPGPTDMELFLWVFQMSTSSEHGGSREGYVSIRRIIESLKKSFEIDATHEDEDEKVKID